MLKRILLTARTALTCGKAVRTLTLLVIIAALTLTLSANTVHAGDEDALENHVVKGLKTEMGDVPWPTVIPYPITPHFLGCSYMPSPFQIGLLNWISNYEKGLTDKFMLTTENCSVGKRYLVNINSLSRLPNGTRYVVVIQVLNPEGVVCAIHVKEGTILTEDYYYSALVFFTPPRKGTWIIQFHFWTSLEDPYPLAPKYTARLVVTR